MDRTKDVVTFAHPNMRGGGDPVRVRQNTDDANAADAVNIASQHRRDPTARWVWDAATSTATWLCEHPEFVRGRDVVEIGAGTGLLGIVASRLGAKRVTLTDLPSELPLLRRNVAANANANASAAGIDDGGEETWSYGDHQSDAGTKLRVMPCAWGDDAALASLGTYDVVLCSDALYQNDEETQAKLARTLSQLTNRETPDARALFAYHFRENLAADRRFFEAIATLMSDPKQHDVVDGELDADELWLFEYAHAKKPAVGGS